MDRVAKVGSRSDQVQQVGREIFWVWRCKTDSHLWIQGASGSAAYTIVMYRSYLWIDQTDLIQEFGKSTTTILSLVNGIEAWIA